MPRKIIARGARGSDFETLLDTLARELTESKYDAGQPLILEREMSMHRALQIDVVWDRFAELEEPERTAMILEAYDRALPERRARITSATGFTVPEAAESGLLPFCVVSAQRRKDPLEIEQYREALRQEGASELRNPGSPELRFYSEEDAAAAIERLESRVPGSHWILTQDVNDYRNALD